MSKLKSENLEKCLSILRGFIDESQQDGKKGIAVLALDQLQRITAGDGGGGSTNGGDCESLPRID
jgi:hypothetical protein